MSSNQKFQKQALFRLIGSLALLVIAVAAGALLGTSVSESTRNMFAFITLGALILLVAFLVFNAVAARLYKNSKSNKNAQQTMEYYLERKEKAARDLPRAIRKIVFLRRAFECYAVLIAILSLIIAFAVGMEKEISAGLILLPFYLLYALSGRILPSPEKFDFKDYTIPEEYPVLYDLAHKAARTLKVDGAIRIQLLPNSNAGIAKIGKTYSLQLGVQLLDILSEEELYQVLLHEFAHQTKDGNPSDKEFRLFTHITEREENTMTQFLNLLFLFPDLLFAFEYLLYRMISSAGIEALADSAILTHGDPQTATNALAKSNLYDRFDYEIGEHISEHYYEPEEPRRDSMNIVVTAFRQALAKRQTFWSSLLMNEIEPRVASHPIFKNRMKALGCSHFEVTLPNDEGSPYRLECQKAMQTVNDIVYERSKEGYAERREEFYLKPLKIVKDWENSGKRLSAEEYRPVLDALGALDRKAEQEALCDEIIATSDNLFATAHAQQYKGILLLRRYDKAGIDHIYRAIEINHNYIDDGMNEIGSFCCMMGLQEELEIYRQKVLELRQYQIDEYDQTGELNANDNLISEQLPDGMLESILTFIKDADSTKSLKRIFLVRKIISEKFFTSVFVLEYKENTSSEIVESVTDKVFNHLDTRPEDWQFSLFLYDTQKANALKKVKNCCIYDDSASQ